MALTFSEIMMAASPGQRKLFNQISRCLAEFGLTFEAIRDPDTCIADHLSADAFLWLGEATQEIDWDDLTLRVIALRKGVSR